MAYYLSKERNEDVVGAYRRYQEYLRMHEKQFPRGAFELGTAEWWQNPKDHRSPHDGWLEEMTFNEGGDLDRITSIRVKLLGAYLDGFIEIFYPRVFSYSLQSPDCAVGLGDWRYDEFRLSEARHVIHEIEWAGFPNQPDSRWIIEASDIEYKWIPK